MLFIEQLQWARYRMEKNAKGASVLAEEDSQ